MPAIADSSTLSISSWRITRQRVAPSDTRTEISRARLVARDSSRLATLAQAISSTNATAPISDRNIDADRAAVLLFVERLDARLDVLVGVGILRLESLRDVDHLALRLLARDAGRQVAERLQRARVALLFEQAVDLVERHPHVRVERKLEAFRHHADDRRRHVVDAHRPADHRRVAAVSIHPHLVADQRHRRSAGPIVVRHEIASDHRPHAEHAKRVRRHVRAVVALGRLAFVAQVGERAAVGAEGVERLGALLPIAVIEVRHAHGGDCARDRTNRSPSCDPDRRWAGRGSAPRSRK